MSLPSPVSSSIAYAFTNVGAQKYLDAPNSACGNGVQLEVWHLDEIPPPTNQVWGIYDAGNGFCKICTLLNTSFVLDVPSSNTTNGTRIVFWQDNGGANQHWQLVVLNSPTLTVKIVSALNPNKVLGVPAGSTADGTPVQIQDDNGGGLNQQWALIDALHFT